MSIIYHNGGGNPTSKPIRMIELFAGYGSQAMAMSNIGANFESYKISEWEVNVNKSYNAIHNIDKTDYANEKPNEELANYLYNICISNDGKVPMEYEKILKKGGKWLKETYNQFIQNHNLGSITNIHYEDLEVVDVDKYLYFVTYSFPCTDVSNAGLQQGMKKGSGTRSGLLWEVERLLLEAVDENKPLPQILFMENVPQVHGAKNIDDFKLWIEFLDRIGYKSFYTDLNAKDFGVPQNRKRCFMVSLLKSEFGDDVEFTFPIGKGLQGKTIEDILEDEVDEKYYLISDRAKILLEKIVSGEFKNRLKAYCNMEGENDEE